MKDRAWDYFKGLNFISPQSYDQELVDNLLVHNESALNRGIARVFYSYVDGLSRSPGKTSEHNLLAFLEQIPEQHLLKSKVLDFF
jgi:hypothetical protein